MTSTGGQTNMARKQRGKAASSMKQPPDEQSADNLILMLEPSDDEAPEEVTFVDSKAEALSSMKRALDSVRREKELLREKRRRRQELFQEQKKRKLLPADVLEEMGSAPSKKQKQSDDEGEEEEEEEEGAGSEEEEVEEAESRVGKEKKKKNRKLAHVRNLKGNYTVATVKERETASFQRQAAEDFIQSRLYGPGSCRTTSNELLSLQNKKAKQKSAAVAFVKKDWACKEKAKAEKIKKRWIHKQQIPSS